MQLFFWNTWYVCVFFCEKVNLQVIHLFYSYVLFFIVLLLRLKSTQVPIIVKYEMAIKLLYLNLYLHNVPTDGTTTQLISKPANRQINQPIYNLDALPHFKLIKNTHKKLNAPWCNKHDKQRHKKSYLTRAANGTLLSFELWAKSFLLVYGAAFLK